MTSEKMPVPVSESADEPVHASRRVAIVQLVERLVTAIRTGDEAMVERTVLALSQRSRWLAPLGLLVGAFAMLFQGVKLLFTNWRLTLVQILPAMWIWAAMLDLKAHALHGKEFHLLRGPLLWLVLLVIGDSPPAVTSSTRSSRSPSPSQVPPRFARRSPKRKPTSAPSSPGVYLWACHLASPPWLSIAGGSSGSP